MRWESQERPATISTILQRLSWSWLGKSENIEAVIWVLICLRISRGIAFNCVVHHFHPRLGTVSHVLHEDLDGSGFRCCTALAGISTVGAGMHSKQEFRTKTSLQRRYKYNYQHYYHHHSLTTCRLDFGQLGPQPQRQLPATKTSVRCEPKAPATLRKLSERFSFFSLSTVGNSPAWPGKLNCWPLGSLGTTILVSCNGEGVAMSKFRLQFWTFGTSVAECQHQTGT